MSDLPSIPAARAMPLFFRRIVGVNPQQHSQLRLDRDAGYGFAKAAQSIPLALTELELVAQHYPVLFTTGANPIPVP